MMTTNYEAQIAEYDRATADRLDTWVPAAGGTEPISEIEGHHYQMMFNPATGEHAYYHFESDMFPAYDDLPGCLTGRWYS